MPYDIRKRPEGYHVINQNTGESKGVSKTRAEAEAHMRALYANEPGKGPSSPGMMARGGTIPSALDDTYTPRPITTVYRDGKKYALGGVIKDEGHDESADEHGRASSVRDRNIIDKMLRGGVVGDKDEPGEGDESLRVTTDKNVTGTASVRPVTGRGGGEGSGGKNKPNTRSRNVAQLAFGGVVNRTAGRSSHDPEQMQTAGTVPAGTGARDEKPVKRSADKSLGRDTGNAPRTAQRVVRSTAGKSASAPTVTPASLETRGKANESIPQHDPDMEMEPVKLKAGLPATGGGAAAPGFDVANRRPAKTGGSNTNDKQRKRSKESSDKKDAQDVSTFKRGGILSKISKSMDKGGLHRSLGVPEGEKIPEEDIAAAAKRPGKVGRQARLAQTFAAHRNG